MKKIPCSYKDCGSRRIHYTLQDISRGQQLIEVSDDHDGEAYCSLTCAMLDGKMGCKTCGCTVCICDNMQQETK